MTSPRFEDGQQEDERPRVVVRDKRRIDPVTGEVRVPGASEAPGTAEVADAAEVQVDEGAIGGVPTDADGGHPDVQTEPDELESLRTELTERTGDLQRISAEYANYRRRVERDRQSVVAMAKAQVAAELLTVLDDVERAAAHGDLSGAFKAVADKLVTALSAQGLEPFGAEGDVFDPDVHEAVQHDTSPEVSGPTVTTVMRRGYRLGERVLRPAMVAVTDAGAAAPAPSDAS